MSLRVRLEDRRAEQGDADPGLAARLHDLFDELWRYRLDEYPEVATYLGEPGPTHKWTDNSLEAIDRRKADIDDALEALEALAALDAASDQGGGLSDTDRTSLRLAIYEWTQAKAGAAFPQELLALTTMSGLHVDMPQVLSLMPSRTLGDLDDVVARLHGLPVMVDQTISLLDEGMRAGVTAPQVVAAQLAPAVHVLIDEPSVLLAAFDSIGDPSASGMDADDLRELRGDADDALRSAAVPALRRLAAYLADTYVPGCRETTAMADLPDGRQWYAQLARYHKTTDLTPDEIHQTGLDEVARIRGEMDAVIASTDFTGDFSAFAEFLRTDDRFYFTTPEALLSHYRDLAKRADAEIPRLFGLLPRLPYGVKAVPDHEAPTSAAAFYLPGSLELGRPGWFCANTYDLRARPTYDMEATCLHETVPGHHLQIALAAELEGLPKFRTKSWEYTAYVEGWGLYAESLGDEMGFYTDAYTRFGQLASELWRAIRLVVDTGLHVGGWSREQAIDYAVTNSTAPPHDARAEIDRYLSIPGQALAYKVGELTIKRLRAEAASGLGERFDVRSFHDLVLGGAALPLGILEERVRGWISAGSG